MRKILALFLSLALLLGTAMPAFAATGEGNIDGGGGNMGSGNSSSYWNPGMDGVRVTVINAESHAVVTTPVDLTNKTPSTGIIHFGKVCKLTYNGGASLSPVVGGYSYRNPSQSLPRIISSGSSSASIEAIRSYFTDEQVIRSLAGYVGMDFDTLVNGDYKIIIEPIAYLNYDGQQFAMTATEAALYDQVVSGDLRYWMGSLTHQNLPLAIFLEEADLGYTKEILGHCVSSRMTVSLVKSAYDVMMENHGHELRGAACVIHSDQGSQYLSTTFQRLLSDDGFLQSVSDRGNSQDNAPMESFFGRLKCELLDLVALCPDASTVSRMISGYIDAYNHRHYQYALAGLTPSEYYTYVTTGIYPVDNYYGIKATELMPIQALIAARRRAAEEKAKKYREASAKKRAMAQGKKKDPEFVIARDQRILRREIAKWTRSKELALQQISHLREILELSQKARAYLMTASADLILQLYNGENWEAHPELAYIYKMRELF